MAFGCDPQPLQDLTGLRVEGGAVEALDRRLERRVALAVEVLLGAGEHRFFLVNRPPELLVAHHHDVEDPLALVLEVVLSENTEASAFG